MTTAPRPLHISFYPKSELVVSHSSIDSALKTLKSSSKQLQTTLSAFRDEMHILERLYYKGKNQHRSALFWRRVCDLRRYGDRINRLKLDVLVEHSRRSFWGPIDKQNTKMLKGSWTHFPDINFFHDADKRLCTFHLLCNQSLGRVTDAYQQFSLCMQSGAFIQLLLVLCGISSRARGLVIELVDIIDLCRKNYATIMQVLSANAELRLKSIGASISHEGPLQTIEPSPLVPLKEALVHKQPETISDQHVDATRVGTEILFESKVGINNGAEPTEEQHSCKQTKKMKSSKKPKKRDEIDEIFDF